MNFDDGPGDGQAETRTAPSVEGDEASEDGFDSREIDPRAVVEHGHLDRGGPLQSNWDDLTEFAVWDPVADVELARVPFAAEGVGWLGPTTSSAGTSARSNSS